jgi:hypothetical protein
MNIEKVDLMTIRLACRIDCLAYTKDREVKLSGRQVARKYCGEAGLDKMRQKI